MWELGTDFRTFEWKPFTEIQVGRCRLRFQRKLLQIERQYWSGPCQILLDDALIDDMTIAELPKIHWKIFFYDSIYYFEYLLPLLFRAADA